MSSRFPFDDDDDDDNDDDGDDDGDDDDDDDDDMFSAIYAREKYVSPGMRSEFWNSEPPSTVIQDLER